MLNKQGKASIQTAVCECRAPTGWYSLSDTGIHNQQAISQQAHAHIYTHTSLSNTYHQQLTMSSQHHWKGGLFIARKWSRSFPSILQDGLWLLHISTSQWDSVSSLCSRGEWTQSHNVRLYAPNVTTSSTQKRKRIYAGKMMLDGILNSACLLHV